MLLGAAFCAMAGALAAAPKRLDMFGVIVVGVATALGGGTLRDILLGTRVFWVVDPVWVLLAIGAAAATFFVARVVNFRRSVVLVFDALGLALYTIVGCEKALGMHLAYSVAVMMGIITGVAGGITRDLLCDEVPEVFRGGALYATAAFIGTLPFLGLLALGVNMQIAAWTGVVVTLVVRLAALKWNIELPIFVVRESKRKTDR